MKERVIREAIQETKDGAVAMKKGDIVDLIILQIILPTLWMFYCTWTLRMWLLFPIFLIIAPFLLVAGLFFPFGTIVAITALSPFNSIRRELQ